MFNFFQTKNRPREFPHLNLQIIGDLSRVSGGFFRLAPTDAVGASGSVSCLAAGRGVVDDGGVLRAAAPRLLGLAAHLVLLQAVGVVVVRAGHGPLPAHQAVAALLDGRAADAVRPQGAAQTGGIAAVLIVAEEPLATVALHDAAALLIQRQDLPVARLAGADVGGRVDVPAAEVPAALDAVFPSALLARLGADAGADRLVGLHRLGPMLGRGRTGGEAEQEGGQRQGGSQNSHGSLLCHTTFLALAGERGCALRGVFLPLSRYTNFPKGICCKRTLFAAAGMHRKTIGRKTAKYSIENSVCQWA